MAAYSWESDQIGVLLVTSKVISKACSRSARAYDSARGNAAAERLLLCEVESKTAWISFPGTAVPEDVVVDSEYGVCPIAKSWKQLRAPPVSWKCSPCNANVFEDSSVHQGFSKRFIETWNNNLCAAIDKALSESDPLENIVFTGHSLGGAIAALAALWLLSLKSTGFKGCKLGRLKIACITFGMPFVGDGKLSEVVQSQTWTQYFCHVVSRHDIVPRILLAPMKSLRKPLAALLPFWFSSSTSTKTGKLESVAVVSVPRDVEEAHNKLASKLSRCASAVASYVSALYKGSSIALQSVFKVSPYRPFGTYILCTTNGAVCLDNPVTVLHMLHLTLSKRNHAVGTSVSHYVLEHTLRHYQLLLAKIPENVLDERGGEAARIAVGETQSMFELGTVLQLEALGLGVKDIQGKLVLLQDRDTGEMLHTNIARRHVEFAKVQQAMARLEWFKLRCERSNQHYYDEFKCFRDEEALEANINRLVVISFWDETLEMYERKLLPLDFKTQNKWVNCGQVFRLLVEPLDVANYYRLGKRDDTQKSYLECRPRRYKTLEHWWKQKDRELPRQNLPSLTQDSTFWGGVEEATRNLCAVEKELDERSKARAKDELEKFKNHVTQLAQRKSLALDVKLSGMWAGLVESLFGTDPLLQIAGETA